MAIEKQRRWLNTIPLPLWDRVQPPTIVSNLLLIPDAWQRIVALDDNTVEVTNGESIVTGPEGLRLIADGSQTYYCQQITEMFHRRHPRLRWRPDHHNS